MNKTEPYPTVPRTARNSLNYTLFVRASNPSLCNLHEITSFLSVHAGWSPMTKAPCLKDDPYLLILCCGYITIAG
jgi:hypothetical protein